VPARVASLSRKVENKREGQSARRRDREGVGEGGEEEEGGRERDRGRGVQQFERVY
jgi:hypothetical protein